MNRALSLLLIVAFLIATAGITLAGGHVVTYQIEGDISGDGLGFGVAGAGDVDNDGHDDFIAGTKSLYNYIPGYARVYSGKTGKVLYAFKGSTGYDEFGTSVNAAGDVNADGYADLIVGALQSKGQTAPGYAKIFSGKDGKVLYT